MVPSSEALTSPAALGAALVWSIGQADAQAPAHADWLGWSFSNRYKVRPLASTRIVPTLELAVLTVATPDCPVPAEVVPGAPYAPPPELPELGLLLPHPAAIAPAAASATSASSGRRSSPDLLGGGLLVPFPTCMCVPPSLDPAPALWWTSCCWAPCRAGLGPTMAHLRPGVVVASTQRRLLSAGILTYPLAAMTQDRSPSG